MNQFLVKHSLLIHVAGTVSWELCPTQGRQPRVLGHSTAVVGDTLYIFGGIYHGEAKNDLYMLNTGEWQLVSCRFVHFLWSHKLRLLHYKTLCSWGVITTFVPNFYVTSYRNVLCCFFFVGNLTWTPLRASGKPPSPRYCLVIYCKVSWNCD